MSRGVPVGATSANQVAASKPGSVSAMVGISGAKLVRLAVVTARPRSLPAFNVAEHDRRVGEHERDLLAEQIVHAGRFAAIGDVQTF